MHGTKGGVEDELHPAWALVYECWTTLAAEHGTEEACEARWCGSLSLSCFALRWLLLTLLRFRRLGMRIRVALEGLVEKVCERLWLRLLCLRLPLFFLGLRLRLRPGMGSSDPIAILIHARRHKRESDASEGLSSLLSMSMSMSMSLLTLFIWVLMLLSRIGVLPCRSSLLLCASKDLRQHGRKWIPSTSTVWAAAERYSYGLLLLLLELCRPFRQSARIICGIQLL